jgi:hypothetical protein
MMPGAPLFVSECHIACSLPWLFRLVFATPFPGSESENASFRSCAFAALKVAPVGRLAGRRKMRLAIGLPLHHQQALSDLLERIYDPAAQITANII